MSTVTIFSENTQAPMIRDPDTARFAVVTGIHANPFGRRWLSVVEVHSGNRPTRWTQKEGYTVAL